MYGPHGLEHILCRVVYFIFTFILLPMVRGLFYVTEDSNGALVYIRHPVWNAITRRAGRAYVKQAGLVVQEGEGRDGTHRGSAAAPVGGCRVRWVPKVKGLRPIVRSDPEVREVSRACRKALWCCAMQFPELLGRSLLHREMALGALKSLYPGAGGPRLEMLITDLANCFESLDHGLILKALDRVGACIGPSSRFRVACLRRLTVETTRVTYSDPFDVVTLGHRPVRQPLHPLRSDRVVVPGWMKRKQVSLRDMVQVQDFPSLKAMVEQVLSQWSVVVSKKLYRFNGKGIGQGDMLSSILCSLALGCLDQTLDLEGAVGVRLVDDMLVAGFGESAVVKAHEGVVLGKHYGTCKEEKVRGSLHHRPGDGLLWAGLTLSPDHAAHFNFSAVGTDPVQGLTVRRPAPAADTDASVLLVYTRRLILPWLLQQLNDLCVDPLLNSEDHVRLNVMASLRGLSRRFESMVTRLRTRWGVRVSKVAVRRALGLVRGTVKRRVPGVRGELLSHCLVRCYKQATAHIRSRERRGKALSDRATMALLDLVE